MSPTRPFVRATAIGEFIRHHSCERRFRLDHDNRRETNTLPFFYQLSSTMDPVLQEAGKRREQEWETCVRDAGLVDLCRYDLRPDERTTPWEQFAAAAAALAPGTAAFGREIEVLADLADFRVAGRIDFALLLWEHGVPRLRLVECKASRRDRTYHRVQLVLYRMIVRRLLEALPLQIDGIALAEIECVVARIDEATNEVHDVLQLPPLDLELEEADVARLLAKEGPLTRILAADLEALPYQLDSRCGDCALSVHCFPESARLRRLELLGLDPGNVRALRRAGVENLDALAELDLAGPAARAVRADLGFTENLPALVAQARARRRTLPGGEDGDDPEVLPLAHAGDGQLPVHDQDGHALVRVFLSVHYDYVENRIGALAAHVTRSSRPLSTLFQGGDGRWQPDPDVKEQWKPGNSAEEAAGAGDGGQPGGAWQERPVEGEDVIGFIRKPWSGDYAADTVEEARLVQGFFQRIVKAIGELCPEGWAPVHFYVWNRGELTRLVESCSRCGTELLAHLRELLGCRASLEQLIYSCLEDEVHTRYALGWTGRGLGVATSLKWFGRRFHWTRRVNGEPVALDRLFFQDLFDWKSSLRYQADTPGQPWRPLDDETAARHGFEIRGCFQDALSAPYWRALWGTLPDPNSPDLDPRVARSIRQYAEAGKSAHLRAFLQARVQALRWIEEGIRYKNRDIEKPLLAVDELPSFTLGVDGPARAALDFLRLEQHVRVNDWIAARLLPPLQRVPEGKTLPLRDVQPIAANRLEAWIDLTGYPIDRQALEIRSSFKEGDFVRLCPCADDPGRGQTVGQLLRCGSTGTVQALDWETGRVELSVLPSKGAPYIVPSRAWAEGGDGYTRATVDESPTDFVSSRVDRRLRSGAGSHVYTWFDPRDPQVPEQQTLPAEVLSAYEALLAELDLGKGPLAPDQRRSVLEGLCARVQLLQGPPGTGKTQTTAAAALLRILARVQPGGVVLVTGHTHTAVDTLLGRIRDLLPRFRQGTAAGGHQMPSVRLAKIHSSQPTTSSNGIEDLVADNCANRLAELHQNAVVLLGGTPGSLLKLETKLSGLAAYRQDGGFRTPLLIVDEASMMVFPCFLALASLVGEEGEILLAGDHRQLAPIVGHDWENEDRPPAVLYQPFVSSYVAVQNLKGERGLPDAAITRSTLSYTFRLPAPIRELITRLYRGDGIVLDGPSAPPSASSAAEGWDSLWAGEGLFLVTHSERESKQSNSVEAAIIKEILAAGARQGVLTPASVGIVMPHRAQRSLLKSVLHDYCEAVDVLDTVERLQGGERETIIVSATCSDPVAIAARAEFILNLNRANVAFSRAKRRLIVVCAETLLTCIPAEVEHYAAAALWKSLTAICVKRLGETTIGCQSVSVRSTLPHNLHSAGNTEPLLISDNHI